MMDDEEWRQTTRNDENDVTRPWMIRNAVKWITRMKWNDDGLHLRILFLDNAAKIRFRKTSKFPYHKILVHSLLIPCRCTNELEWKWWDTFEPPISRSKDAWCPFFRRRQWEKRATLRGTRPFDLPTVDTAFATLRWRNTAARHDEIDAFNHHINGKNTDTQQFTRGHGLNGSLHVKHLEHLCSLDQGVLVIEKCHDVALVNDDLIMLSLQFQVTFWQEHA